MDSLPDVYLFWDEKRIRACWSQAPLDRELFWCHIYCAVLCLTADLPLPEDTQPPPEEEEVLLSENSPYFSWWQMRELARVFASTHGRVTFEPWANRFRLHGLTYHIPKELRSVSPILSNAVHPK